MVLKDDLHLAFKQINGLKELTPKEAGGSNKSFEKLLGELL